MSVKFNFQVFLSFPCQGRGRSVASGAIPSKLCTMWVTGTCSGHPFSTSCGFIICLLTQITVRVDARVISPARPLGAASCLGVLS